VNIVTFREPLAASYSKSSGRFDIMFEPLKPYILSHTQLRAILSDEQRKTVVYRRSDLAPRLANFNVTAPKKEGRNKVLFWTGAGGFGDQFMAWPVAQMIHRMGYEVHVLVDPGHTTCWWSFDWVKSVIQFPVYYDIVKMFDHHCFFDVVSNGDEHQDQGHPTDLMLRKIGLDPDLIDAELKVVRPNFTHGEIALTQQVIQGRPIAVYQLAATGATRSLTPSDSAHMLDRLCEAFPEWHWIAVYDTFNGEPYRLKADCVNRPNLQTYFYPNIRDMWCAIAHAKMVVSPDSMSVHVAGSMNVPCVGLWGPVDPATRIKYYRNHIALWKREVCPCSPCFHYHHEFPYFCPPVQGGRKTCEVLQAISADEVIGAAKTLNGNAQIC
jgi:ADP-heptose:LPS heptosyltransferase